MFYFLSVMGVIAEHWELLLSSAALALVPMAPAAGAAELAAPPRLRRLIRCKRSKDSNMLLKDGSMIVFYFFDLCAEPSPSMGRPNTIASQIRDALGPFFVLRGLSNQKGA